MNIIIFVRLSITISLALVIEAHTKSSAELKMSSLISANRRGMLLIDNTTDYLEQTGRRASEESEDSYAEISTSSDDSYYSDGGDLVEYWDPYCEYCSC